MICRGWLLDDGDAVDADDDLIGFLGRRGDYVVITALGRGEGRIDLDGFALFFPYYRDDLSQDGLFLV